MLHILDKLAATSSRKEKEEILKELTGDDEALFKRIADLALSPHYKYELTKDTIPTEDMITESELVLDFSCALDSLEAAGLDGGYYNGERVAELKKTMTCLTEGDREVVRRIIKGNLGCGVSSSTINKVWPGTIFEPPYMRCDTLNKKNVDKIDPPYIVQTKLDGKFVNFILDTRKGEVKIFSRSWTDCTEKYLRPEHIDFVKSLGDERPVVLHGEIIVIDENGNILPREEGNGYLNSDNIDKSRVVFRFWDCVSLYAFYENEFEKPYHQRLDDVIDMMSSEYAVRAGLFAEAGVTVDTIDEVKEVFQTAVRAGEEGIVLKDPNAIWKNGTSKGQLKAKIAVDCDVKIVGVNISTETKYAGQIGSLLIESACGKLHCSVGGGLTDEMRSQHELFQKYIEDGKIITVRYNDVVDNENRPGVKALYLPRIIEFRDDKHEADDLDKIIDQMSTYTLEL